MMDEERSSAEETLRLALKGLSIWSGGSSADLDRVIQQLGPHHVAHFLVTTSDTSAAKTLRTYLNKYWPAYEELVERLIRAARRSPENEDLQSDFGES